MVFVALLVRLALMLGATPVGAMRREIFYLRGDVFRPLVRVVIVFLLLEGTQLGLPALVDAGPLRLEQAATFGAIIDLVQAVLLLVLAGGALRAFAPYSRRSLEDLEVFARRGVATLAGKVARKPPKERARRSP